MKRHEAIKIILDNLEEDDLAIFTTGMISREAFAIGDRQNNFYMIGSMGLTTPVALGIALNKPKIKVVVVEGDGSLLLNLGVLPMVAAEKPANFLHIVLDNETYESTGGQPSISGQIDLAKLATAAGYKNVIRGVGLSSLKLAVKRLLNKKGPNFLLIKVEPTCLKDVPRVSLTPKEMKKRFSKQFERND